ncbi:MAG: ABC transporter permease [Gammaproteobacteria bacterium]|nr:ABC transporter permease [Gammaproteobacteria bacterium]
MPVIFGKITLLAGLDLKLALKDRSTILWLFIMPAVFFYFIGTVTQSGVGFSSSPAELVVTNHDGGFLSQHLEMRLEENLFAVMRPQDVPPVQEGEEPMQRRQVSIPADFTEQLQAGNQVTIQYEGLQTGFSNQYDFFRIQKATYSVLGDLIVVETRGDTLSPAALATATAQPRPVELVVTPAGRQLQIPSGFQQAIPGTLVMFTMLVLLSTGASMLVDEREKQLLRRLASAPFSRGQVVLGKWAGRMALAIVQIGVAVGLSFTPLFDMNWGHSLTMVLVILLAWGALCTSLALLLGSLARTDNQAAGLGVFFTMVLAALGGCWWPIEVAPIWMQRLQLFTPTGWTMDALHKLISFDMAWQDTLPNLLTLIVATFIIGWAAARRFRFV